MNPGTLSLPVCALLFVVAPVCSAAAAQIETATAHGNIILEIVGFQSDAGRVKVALWDQADGFLVSDDYVARAEGVIVEQSSTVVLADVPHGEYAVSVFHDENDNDKLDTGFLRIPKEPIGTSNNARGRFGPPKYDDARFDLQTSELRLTIDLQKL